MDPVAAQTDSHAGGESHSDQRQEGRTAQAARRDDLALIRDRAALARDHSAELRDREVGTREASDRVATDERRAAAADREEAARDREQAARDRLAAQTVRDELLRQLVVAETDQLTGARARTAGLSDIDREIARAYRTGSLLVAVYVDVVGLKVVNDAYGHAAGDALLQRVVGEIRVHLRSYDVIVRLGGDEFLCAMPGATILEASQRFGAIQAALEADSHPSHIKYGLAALGHEASSAELIERADAELPISAPR
jgi:diguanylate cyclase (GGDEF)-like protein